MTEYTYYKFEFIIMIAITLLVAFIIGFNIIQVIDSKLSSVTINVPPQTCNMPPIYLNWEQKSGKIKQIKLNDMISTSSNESILNSEDMENFSNIDDINKNIHNELEHSSDIEKFGNIQDYPLVYDDNRRHLISGTINSDMSTNIINQKTKYQTSTDPNYNTVNNIPLLIATDTDVLNKAGLSDPRKNFIKGSGPNAKGYYSSKVKLIEDVNSPLMKLFKQNANIINEVITKCTLSDKTKSPEVNGTFDGYNSFVDLRNDSYANLTSIGKSMMSPYISFPVPS